MGQPTADEIRTLRRGWTTGACATAATRAAYTALTTGTFPDPVSIVLPKGETPAFPLAVEERGENWARAGIIKDAGDDPDVTHGAMIVVTVRHGVKGTGVTFRAGDGVGMVTKAGLPIAPGEPAINPVPRAMMSETIAQIARHHDASGDVVIEISVPGGAAMALKTWNSRLGILGGISILGTTGIVHPFSCSAWIHSIRSGIDVARAEGLTHVAGATGSTSESAVQMFHALPKQALIDMGDFAGGMLKHLRLNPVPRVTIAGGFGKLSKLARGHLDLHSGRSQVDFDWLGQRLREAGATADLVEVARAANTAAQVLALAGEAGIDIAGEIARCSRQTMLATLRGADIAADVVVINRDGDVIAHAS